ncbi:hypothetical protein OIU77_025349 [Salix suchowensis]|uniref:Uncharacterized protein n=1 Tax=Salix suchowensis TaxID=1278906 RepID=A0ABQ9BYY0_9ROSI|nr:hypothetical protein OIU77_025349 [Salix suchowensis]
MEYTRRLPSLVPAKKHSSTVTVRQVIIFPTPFNLLTISNVFIERTTICPWSPAQTKNSPHLLSSTQLRRPFDSEVARCFPLIEYRCKLRSSSA